jgi:hypothetical protein
MGIRIKAPIWVIIVTGILSVPFLIFSSKVDTAGFTLLLAMPFLWLFIIYPIVSLIFNGRK